MAGLLLSALGDIGDFVGGIAVVITLAHVGIQIRRHNVVLRTASRQDPATGYRVHNARLLDPQVSEIYAVGLRDYPNMPPANKRTSAHTITDHALFFQAAFALYESGPLGIENHSPYLNWFACQLTTPGGSVWWRECHGFYNGALVESVNERLAEGGLPNPLELALLALENQPHQPTAAIKHAVGRRRECSARLHSAPIMPRWRGGARRGLLPGV